MKTNKDYQKEYRKRQLEHGKKSVFLFLPQETLNRFQRLSQETGVKRDILIQRVIESYPIILRS